MKKFLTILLLLFAVRYGFSTDVPLPEELLKLGSAARQSGLNYRIVRTTPLGPAVFYRRSSGDSRFEIGDDRRVKNNDGEFQYVNGGEIAVRHIPRISEQAAGEFAGAVRFEVTDTTVNGRPAYAVKAFFPESDQREYSISYILKQPIFTVGTTTQLRDGKKTGNPSEQVEFFDSLPDNLFLLPDNIRIISPADAAEESLLIAEMTATKRLKRHNVYNAPPLWIAVSLIAVITLTAAGMLIAWRFKRHKRGLLYGSLALWMLLLGFLLYVLVRFWPALSTLGSLTRHGGSLYSMMIDYDYDLPGLLASGAGDETAILTHLRTKYPLISDAVIAPRAGCSTFAVRCGDGATVFCRNFDFSNHAPTAVVFTAPPSGYRSISVCSLGVLEFTPFDSPEHWGSRPLLLALPFVPMDGMNEKGLAAAVLQLPGAAVRQNTGKPPLFTTLVIRLLLDRARSVEEALELLKNYDLADASLGHFHFQIADASGDSAVVEFDANRTWVVRGGSPGQAASNCESGPESGRAKVGADRLEKMTAGISRGLADSAEAAKLLESVRQPSTVWSGVYELSTLRLNLLLPSSGDAAGFCCK